MSSYIVRQTRACICLAALLLAVAGCAASEHHSGQTRRAASRDAHALQLAGPWTEQYKYALTDLSSCQIGDSLTIVNNTASAPVTITDATVSINGVGTGVEERTVDIAPVKAGVNTGELAPSTELATLTGYPLRPAKGIVLAPTTKSGQWYDLVVLLHVQGSHPRTWAIAKITITYLLAGHRFTVSFPQQVQLAAETTCPS